MSCSHLGNVKIFGGVSYKKGCSQLLNPLEEKKKKKLKNNPVGIINGTIMKSSNRK